MTRLFPLQALKMLQQSQNYVNFPDRSLNCIFFPIQAKLCRGETRLSTCKLAVTDSSPTTFQDTLASQTSSCLPHLCIHRAPAKTHRLRKLPLNHFPALAPITGIEVMRSKRKGMQSILFACHQCHFAARQLEKDTHRQKLLAAGVGAWQNSLATARPMPQVGCFTKHHIPLVQLSPKNPLS